MIYLFKDVDRSLSLGIYAGKTNPAPFTLVRNKGQDFTFEMLINKKQGIKVTGFANVVNHLLGNEMFSFEADYVDWLCHHFNPACERSVKTVLAKKDSHELLSILTFVLFKNAINKNKDLVLSQEVLNFVKESEEKYKAQIEKFEKMNAAPAAQPKGKPTGKDSKKPAQKKEEKKAVSAPAPKKEKKKDDVPEEYKKKVYGLKLQRLNKGEVILPKEGQKNILVTSALPYVNNVPHLGNLVGSTLSADVYARYSRLRGNNTVYICGTDMYGSASEIKAIKEGKSPQEVTDYFHKIHKEIYDDFDLDFDYFGKTTTPQHTEIVQDIFNKNLKNGFFHPKSSEGFFSKKYKIGLADRFIQGTCPHCGYEHANGDQCDKCGKLLTPDQLLNPKCSLSGEDPEKKETQHYYLDLTSLESKVHEFIKKNSAEGKWSPNSVSISESWIKTGLEPRSMTRDLNWGVKVPIEGFDNKVFYVWFDAPIGYLSITANYTNEWEKWWKNPSNVQLFQFMGKDNVPFHTVMFPASLIGTSDNYTMLHHISTTEYLNYESGKFSKSHNRGVFGNHIKELPFINSCWRYYLMINRPENADSVFKWEDFAAKVNQELLQNPGNLLNRVLQFLYKNNDKTIPVAKPTELSDSDKEFLQKIHQKIQTYCNHMDFAKLKDGLKLAMEVSSDCNKFVTDNEIWSSSADKERRRVVLTILSNAIRVLACLFEPFMPGFSAIVYFFLGLERTPLDEQFLSHLLSLPADSLVTLLPEGLKMNQPIPIFNRVEDIQQYQQKFN